MTTNHKVFRTLVISGVGALLILASAWYFNGTHFKDFWLYLTVIWIVIMAFVDDYFNKKK